RVDRERESLIAHSMDMDVEPMTLDSPSDLVEFVGCEHQKPAFMVMATVGALEGSGEILTDAVEHDLHTGGLYASVGTVALDPSDHVSTLLERLELLGVGHVPIPPERGGDFAVERASFRH